MFLFLLFFEKLIRKMLSLQHAGRQKLLMTKEGFEHSTVRKNLGNKLLYCICMMFMKTDAVCENA